MYQHRQNKFCSLQIGKTAGMFSIELSVAGRIIRNSLVLKVIISRQDRRQPEGFKNGQTYLQVEPQENIHIREQYYFINTVDYL